jgi:hypothetical protein
MAEYQAGQGSRTPAFGQRCPEGLEKIKRQQKSNLFMWHREIINRQPNYQG